MPELSTPLTLSREMQLWREPRLDGVALGHASSVIDFGALGWACASAASHDEVLATYARFARLVSHHALAHEASGARVTLRWSDAYADTRPAQYVCFEAASLTWLLHHIVRARPVAVAVPLKRKELDDSFEDRLGCAVRFEASVLSVHYTRTLADLTNPYADEMLHQAGVALCERAIESLHKAQGFAAQVRAAMFRAGPGTCSVATAESVLVSERTMHRRLHAEGTSYQEVSDEVRLDLCLRALSSGPIAHTELAKHLGFSDARGLTRAFRRWTGTTLGAYQRRART